MKKTITVLGMGYIGLPTALLLADVGNEVFGFDIDNRKIEKLKKGMLPFEEKGLKSLFDRVLTKNTFSPVSKIEKSGIFLIAVPTPQKNAHCDLSFIIQALDSIKDVFEEGNLLVVESTVGPTDCEEKIIPEIKKFGRKFHFAYCPERAIPGDTLSEMVINARIIGGINKEDAILAKEIYSTFVTGDVFTTDLKVASACKLMENTFRDVNIALANEFALIADEIGFDVWKAIELANKHPRVNIHQPGPGVGGHCIPIDPWFFVGESSKSILIKKARETNNEMPLYVCQKVKKLIKKFKIYKPIIGILGYSYKKNVDDFRETPAEQIITNLSKDYKVLVNDPYIKNPPIKMVNLQTLLTKSEVLVLVTDHDCYKEISFKKYPQINFVYDTRNFLQENNTKESNIKIYKLGEGSNENIDCY